MVPPRIGDIVGRLRQRDGSALLDLDIGFRDVVVESVARTLYRRAGYLEATRYDDGGCEDRPSRAWRACIGSAYEGYADVRTKWASHFPPSFTFPDGREDDPEGFRRYLWRSVYRHAYRHWSEGWKESGSRLYRRLERKLRQWERSGQSTEALLPVLRKEAPANLGDAELLTLAERYAEGWPLSELCVRLAPQQAQGTIRTFQEDGDQLPGIEDTIGPAPSVAALGEDVQDGTMTLERAIEKVFDDFSPWALEVFKAADLTPEQETAYIATKLLGLSAEELGARILKRPGAIGNLVQRAKQKILRTVANHWERSSSPRGPRRRRPHGPQS